MNALELISNLVELVSRHGNQEVVFFNGDDYKHIDVITLQTLTTDPTMTRLELE